MTTYKIATCHNSLTNGEKAHSATNPGLQLGDFYVTCQLMIYFELATSSIGPTYHSRDNHGNI